LIGSGGWLEKNFKKSWDMGEAQSCLTSCDAKRVKKVSEAPDDSVWVLLFVINTPFLVSIHHARKEWSSRLRMLATPFLCRKSMCRLAAGRQGAYTPARCGLCLCLVCFWSCRKLKHKCCHRLTTQMGPAHSGTEFRKSYLLPHHLPLAIPTFTSTTTADLGLALRYTCNYSYLFNCSCVIKSPCGSEM